jgi:hypothetical protein
MRWHGRSSVSSSRATAGEADVSGLPWLPLAGPVSAKDWSRNRSLSVAGLLAYGVLFAVSALSPDGAAPNGGPA